jgi:hypothetical protein
MNYKKHYDRLVHNANHRERPVIFENHHILPKCVGGSDNTNNLVKLTPEEHLVAHLLLVRIYPDEEKLLYAAHLMSCRVKSNKHYGWVRRQFATKISNSIKTAWAKKYGFCGYAEQISTIWDRYVEGESTESIAKRYGMSQSNVRGSIRAYATEFDLLSVLEDLRFQKRSRLSKHIRQHITVEQEAYRIQKTKSADYSARNRKMSLDRKGSGNPMFGRKIITTKVNCQYCGKTGAVSQMKRWHFDNCKLKEIL